MPEPIHDPLAALAQPFRTAYLTYEQLTAQLHAWAAAYPQFARVRSIGRSTEGRELWLLTVGPDPERVRPGVWVDGNMHAGELCGSSVALAIAEDALRLHTAPPDASCHDLPPHVRARLRDVVFHVLARVAPDGAEAVLRDGRYVRSNPRDRRPATVKPRWVCRDIDGDGLSLLMRKRDQAGEFVESRVEPGVLVPRALEDEGPFFKLYPEGVVDPWDGTTVPDPYFLSDNDTDLNRNFPWSWAPEPEQVGAGAHALSEPEARAVVEYTTEHPELFVWLNLHTFGGVYIRPLGNAPDKKMDPFDLAVFRQVGAWNEQISGYPMVAGFEEFLYEPDKPLHGDLADYGYHQRGCVAYVCELWDLFKRLGHPRRKPFIEHYSFVSREQTEALARWDREHNAGRVVRPWRAASHPQLGQVEVGGVDPRVGLINPPYELIAETCTQQSAAFMRVAATVPVLAIGHVAVTQLGPGPARRVEVTVENRGYLPTYGVGAARERTWNEAPVAVARASGGCDLASPDDARREVGHLAGWGRGLYGVDGALFYQRSRGSVSSRTLAWVVTGRGVVTVRVGSCRTGYVETRIELA